MKKFFAIFVSMLVDTHTHFYDEWLLPDAEAAIQRALEAGVGKMIQADIDSRERPAMWEIGRRHPGVLFQMAGVYPGSITADNWQYELDQVHDIFGRGSIPHAGPGPGSMPQNGPEAICAGPGPGGKNEPRPNLPGTSSKFGPDQVHDIFTEGVVSLPVASAFIFAEGRDTTPSVAEHIVAIGEIGLDYHEGKEFAREQKEALRVQLELAAAKNLPVNIHLRDAWEDLLTILKDCRHLNLRGNLHCFSGSYEVYREANRYGDWSVGIGGVVTFKNSGLPKTLERIPMEHILLETDAPYLAPTPHRGERNESALLPLVAAKVAEIKGLTTGEVADITTRNAEKLFNI